MPRVKRLVRHGNSQAVILDRSLMDVVGIEPNSMISIDVKDNKLLIGPAETSTDESRRSLIQESLDKGLSIRQDASEAGEG